MPVEFLHETGDNSKDYKLLMAYDGSGRRISKTRYAKDDQFGYWYLDHVTHYTGIGTEVREAMRRSASPKPDVVVNMPQGLGRYGVERYSDSYVAKSANENTQASFEWFLKNHIGSTMLVYGTQTVDDAGFVDLGSSKAAYDYRAFGEQITFSEPTEKVTENFTGKELDDETELNYFGARYLDPMLGMWTSVDAARQYDSPYTYVGNNPIFLTDPDGNIGLLGAAASTPSAFVNLVSAEKKSMEQGNSYAAVVRDGLEAFAVTLILGATFGPKTALGKAVVNAGASAAMNVHDQVTIEHKSLKNVDVEEAAMQSRDGFVAGAIGAGAGSFASKPLLGKTAEFVDGFVSSAVGSAAAAGAEIVKNKNQNE